MVTVFLLHASCGAYADADNKVVGVFASRQDAANAIEFLKDLHAKNGWELDVFGYRYQPIIESDLEEATRERVTEYLQAYGLTDFVGRRDHNDYSIEEVALQPMHWPVPKVRAF